MSFGLSKNLHNGEEKWFIDNMSVTLEKWTRTIGACVRNGLRYNSSILWHTEDFQYHDFCYN